MAIATGACSLNLAAAPAGRTGSRWRRWRLPSRLRFLGPALNPENAPSHQRCNTWLAAQPPGPEPDSASY